MFWYVVNSCKDFCGVNIWRLPSKKEYLEVVERNLFWNTMKIWWQFILMNDVYGCYFNVPFSLEKGPHTLSHSMHLRCLRQLWNSPSHDPCCWTRELTWCSNWLIYNSVPIDRNTLRPSFLHNSLIHAPLCSAAISEKSVSGQRTTMTGVKKRRGTFDSDVRQSRVEGDTRLIAKNVDDCRTEMNIHLNGHCIHRILNVMKQLHICCILSLFDGNKS